MADEQPDRVSVPTLVMTGGPLDGTAYPLQFTGREIVVGSSLDADVQILLGNVESFHSRISFESGALLLSDAGSATGTFVNGEKIENAHPLQEGDRICLGPPGAKGSAKLVVRMPGSTQSPLLFGSEGPPSLGDEEGTPSSDEESSLYLGSGGGLPPAFQMPSEDDEPGAGPLIDSGPDASHAGLVSDEDHDEALFVSPLPSVASARAPAPPALDDEIPLPALGSDHEQGLPAPAPRPADAAVKAAPAPPPPPRPAAPAPPPPPPAHSQRLTAPPPPPPAAARPEYQSELPSIPFAKTEEPSPEPFPPLRPPARPAPAARQAPARKRPAARRRGGLGLPSLPLPVVAGALGVALLAGLVWFFAFRKKPPEIVSIAPPKVEAGQTITLTGKHFAKEPADNVVVIGTLSGHVIAASERELKVVVPEQAKSQLAVTVETRAGRSEPVALNVVAVAVASAVEPDVAMPGQSVVIHGDGFSAKNVAVRFAGLPAASVEEVPGGLRVVVPQVSLPEGSASTVTVEVGNRPARTFPFIFGHLPLVIEAAPAKGPAGQKTTLKGRGFAPHPRANAVVFGRQPALVLAATETALTVIAPAPPVGELTPEVPIVVTVGDRSSGGRASFSYERGSTSGFNLLFFPTPASEYPAEDLAFVSTELGPVLLLGGPATAATTAERGAAVAAALDAAVDADARQHVAFELRERPEPGVALVGAPAPFLVATQADANAYAKPWAGTARRVTPVVLARHWLALLQDYFGLFLHRERPVQMLTLSPNGQVLSDLYAEANRRAPGGTNVPVSLVMPPTPALAAGLRQMALAVAAEGGRSGVALEGTWTGTIEDVDLGNRRFRVVVRQDKGRLAGEITTARGGVELSSPLREIAFDHGKVRFTANLDGSPHRFEGTLTDVTVSGTITRPRNNPAKFTMQYGQ